MTLAGPATFMLLLLLAVTSCLKNPLETPPDIPGIIDPVFPDSILTETLETQNCDTFNYIIRNLAIYNAPPEIGVVAQGDASTATQNGWRCTSQSFKASEGFNELNVMGQVPFYPTMLCDGKSIATGGNKAIICDRNPWTISTDLNTNGSPTEIVEHPEQLSSYREALQRLLNRANFSAPPPANVSFEIDSVYSSEQAQMLSGANFGGWGAKVSANYNFGNESTRGRLLVKFVQRYYSVDMNDPANPCDLFDTLPDLRPFGTSPMYVSSVIYGRVAYLMVESSHSMDSLAWAINASYSGFGYDGGLSVHYKAKNIVNSAKIRGFILGGNGNDAVGAIDGFEGLKAYIMGGGNPSLNSPGAPIAYKFKNLVDGSDVRIVLSSEYTIRTCDNVGEIITAPGYPSEIFQCGMLLEGFGPDNEYHEGQEFGGNGPEVIGSFLLKVENANEVHLIVDVTWEETAENHSMAVAHIDQVVYTAPPGKILGAFPDLDKASFFYTDQATDVIDTPPVTGGSFIEGLRVVGDSDGNDMDCDPNKDCGIRFKLKPFRVSIKDL